MKNKGMMTIMTTSFISSYLTPLGMTFITIMVSLMTSMMMLTTAGASMPAAAVVISFSSGLMILFCYCSTLAPYETNKKPWMPIYLLLLVCPAIVTISEMESKSSGKENSPNSTQTFFLVCAMGVVIMTMVSINKSMVTMNKSLLSSY